jgi:cyclic pyranopterin phosphate synthase
MSTGHIEPDQAPGRRHGLTHIDERGRARMVDVSAKDLTKRVAVAKCIVLSTKKALLALLDPNNPLSVIEAARFAGIQAAKQTAALIPLCHPIHVERVSVDFHVDHDRVGVTAIAEIVERTGVEMEALTACGIAALTLAASFMESDPDVSIEYLTLWQKSGGRSGNWDRASADDRLTLNTHPRADRRQ